MGLCLFSRTEKSESYLKALSLWNLAHEECTAAEGVLDFVPSARRLILFHIARSWQLLGLLALFLRSQQNPKNEFLAANELLDALSQFPFRILPQEMFPKVENVLTEITPLALLRPNLIPTNADSELESIDVYETYEQLRFAVGQAKKGLMRTYEEALSCKLKKNWRSLSALTAVIALVLYISGRAFFGFWNPQLWLFPKVGQFAMLSSQQGFGVTRINASIDGRPLTVGKVVFSSGIGTHAYSSVVLAFEGRRTTFKALCGVDNEVGENGSIQCQVKVNGEVVATTPILRAKDSPAPLQANVRNTNVIELIVKDGSDGLAYDHADWVNLSLE